MELGTGNVKIKLTVYDRHFKKFYDRSLPFVSVFQKKNAKKYFKINRYFQASAKTEGNTASPPAPDYATSGLTHTGLLSRDAPATSPNTIQTNSTMLAASSTAATATPTDTTPTAATHMPSYGGALAASSSAYALGGPYSGYPYANLVSKIYTFYQKYPFLSTTSILISKYPYFLIPTPTRNL